MVEENADQHLHHLTVELKGELRCQDQLENRQDKKKGIIVYNRIFIDYLIFLSSFIYRLFIYRPKTAKLELL